MNNNYNNNDDDDDDSSTIKVNGEVQQNNTYRSHRGICVCNNSRVA